MRIPPKQSFRMSGIALIALLLVSACGGEGGGEGSAEGGEEGGASAASLGGDGFLALACGESSITVSRFSGEDGSLQAEHIYSAAAPTPAEEPRLPNGRTIGTLKGLELPDCVTDPVEDWDRGLDLTRNQAHELAGLVIPEHSLLLVDIIEEIDGSDVRTIGALSADGKVEALLPAAEAGGFSGAPVSTSPRYRNSDNTVYFLESTTGDASKVVKSINLESGDVQESGSCDSSCERIIVDPYSEVVYGTITTNGVSDLPANQENNHARYFSNHDGSMAGLFSSFSVGRYIFLERDPGSPSVVGRAAWSGHPSDAESEDVEWIRRVADARSVDDYAGLLPVFTVGTGEILLNDDSFTVRKFDDEYREETEDREILPDSGRTNEFPVLSADREQILFRSTDGAGNVSWFSVPVSGGEPQEIGSAEGEHTAMVPIHWF